MPQPTVGLSEYKLPPQSPESRFDVVPPGANPLKLEGSMHPLNLMAETIKPKPRRYGSPEEWASLAEADSTRSGSQASARDITSLLNSAKGSTDPFDGMVRQEQLSQARSLHLNQLKKMLGLSQLKSELDPQAASKYPGVDVDVPQVGSGRLEYPSVLSPKYVEGRSKALESGRQFTESLNANQSQREALMAEVARKARVASRLEPDLAASQKAEAEAMMSKVKGLEKRIKSDSVGVDNSKNDLKTRFPVGQVVNSTPAKGFYSGAGSKAAPEIKAPTPAESDKSPSGSVVDAINQHMAKNWKRYAVGGGAVAAGGGLLYLLKKRMDASRRSDEEDRDKQAADTALGRYLKLSSVKKKMMMNAL